MASFICHRTSSLNCSTSSARSCAARVRTRSRVRAGANPTSRRARLRRRSLARRDVEFALALTLDRFRTRAAQERALEVLQFKLDVLWQMNDAMALAYGVTQ